MVISVFTGGTGGIFFILIYVIQFHNFLTYLFHFVDSEGLPLKGAAFGNGSTVQAFT